MESGLSTAVLKGANAPRNPSQPELRQSGQTGETGYDLPEGVEVQHYDGGAAAVYNAAPPETRDPALTPPSSRRRELSSGRAKHQSPRARP